MKKLIELDAAIKATWKDTGYTDPVNVMTAIRDRLEALPTVDAVTVVRCKDCKYKSTEDNVWVCPFGLPGGPEFFCGYGVDGKDGEGNG